MRGRGSVDEYLEQTAIANPHVTLHYIDPDGDETTYARSTDAASAGAEEIKPHPYGIELGQLVTMLKDTTAATMAQFLTTSFSRVSSGVAQKICETAKISTRANPKTIGRQEADALYQAIQNTKISAPATDCISPIGEALILKGLASSGARRVFLRRDASARGVSRQSVSDRGRPCLWRRQFDPEGHAGRIDRAAQRRATPARCGSS